MYKSCTSGLSKGSQYFFHDRLPLSVAQGQTQITRPPDLIPEIVCFSWYLHHLANWDPDIFCHSLLNASFVPSCSRPSSRSLFLPPLRSYFPQQSDENMLRPAVVTQSCEVNWILHGNSLLPVFILEKKASICCVTSGKSEVTFIILMFFRTCQLLRT